MRLILSVALLLFLGCAPQSDKPNAASADQSIVSTLHDSIQGVWWADTADPSAAFWIEGDTIRNPEHFSENLIDLRGDSLTFKFPDFQVTQHVAMRGPDTMILSGGEYGGKPTTYFRWFKLQDRILGVWTSDLKNLEDTFRIDVDMYRGPAHDYPITLVGDTLFTERSDGTSGERVIMHGNDTLQINYSDEDSMLFYRVK